MRQRERETIALAIFDDMLVEGSPEDHAALVSRQVLVELERHPGVRELFVVSVTDHFGTPHVYVTPKLPAGDAPFVRLDIVRYCARARRDLIERLKADLRLTDAGTAI